MTNRTSPFVKNRTKIKRIVGPLSLALAMVTLSACEGSATISPTGSATPSVSETATTSALPSSTSAPASNVAGSVINGLPTRKELAQDANGPYIQTTISADDPAMQYNPAIVSPEILAVYTEEEIRAAQQFIVTFVAEEGLDSMMNGTKSDTAILDKWWAANKDKIDPARQEEFYTNVEANDNFRVPVYRYTGKQSKLASGENTTHVNSRKIKINALKTAVLEGKQRLGFDISTETVYNITRDGSPTVNASNGSFLYTLTKDEAGKWTISGYQNTFSDSAA